MANKIPDARITTKQYKVVLSIPQAAELANDVALTTTGEGHVNRNRGGTSDIALTARQY